MLAWLISWYFVKENFNIIFFLKKADIQNKNVAVSCIAGKKIFLCLCFMLLYTN